MCCSNDTTKQSLGKTRVLTPHYRNATNNADTNRGLRI